MFRKSFISLLLMGIVMLAGQTGVFAQSGPVNGTVELEKTGGGREPVAGALVEVYRTDIKTGFPSAKTNKKGEFSFAGFPYGGEFALSVSAPGCTPTIYPGVKAGQERISIILSPGDGKKWTEAEVRKSLAAGGAAAGPGGSTGMSEEDKRAQAEFIKKNAEIEAKNKKIQDGDAIARRTNEEGKAAYDAGNFDLAIAKFTEGAAAVPDYIGSTPILLNGKILALKAKAFKIYREGGASTDGAFRKAKYEEANKVYDEALAVFQEAMTVVQKAEPATEPSDQKRRDLLKNELYAVATEIHRLKAVGGVDTTKSAEASTLINEYIAIEADPVKKLSAQVVLGDIMRLTGDFEKATAAYRAVLTVKADHPEAMAGLGLSLFAQGASTVPEDKEKMQEGLNFMQKYTEISPVAATDSQATKDLKVSVKETVDYLKAQKMTPQKVTSTKKKN